MLKPLSLSDADSDSPTPGAADDQCLPGVAVSVGSGDESYDAERDHANGIYYGLRVATPEAEAQINPCMFSSRRFDSLPEDLVFLPSGDDFGDGSNTDADSTTGSAGLFHRDSHGLTCFSLSEADAASEHIAALKLDERVKECLQKKRFELPQQSAAVSAHFCNESVYGNLNLLCVTGVVRMCESDRWTFERAAAVSSDAAVEDDYSVYSSTFNAWPPPEKRVESQNLETVYSVDHWSLEYEHGAEIAARAQELLVAAAEADTPLPPFSRNPEAQKIRTHALLAAASQSDTPLPYPEVLIEEAARQIAVESGEISEEEDEGDDHGLVDPDA